MVDREVWEVITAREFLDELVRSLDPLAFESCDPDERERRRRAAHLRIAIALTNYRRLENRYGDEKGICDLDIPW